MSSPQRSEVLSFNDEDETSSIGYMDEYDETDSNSTSGHHCELDFTVLEDAGDGMPDDSAAPSPSEDNAQMCHAQPLGYDQAWTDNMHRLYLDSIEEAFVRNLYQCRWSAEDVECGESDEEEVESNLCEPQWQIGGATNMLTLPDSDNHRGGHEVQHHDDITDCEDPPKKRRRGQQMFKGMWTTDYQKRNFTAMETVCREF